MIEYGILWKVYVYIGDILGLYFVRNSTLCSTFIKLEYRGVQNAHSTKYCEQETLVSDCFKAVNI